MSKDKINQRGITLIALIITIIVMLILVGVSVTVALKGGLFTTAKQATKETEIASEKEILFSIAMGAIGNDGKVVLSDLDADIAEDGRFTGSNWTYENVKSGNVYTVSEYGSVTLKTEEIGSEETGVELIVGQYKVNPSTLSITQKIDYSKILTEEQAIKIVGKALGAEVNNLKELNTFFAENVFEISYEELASMTGKENPTDQDIFEFILTQEVLSVQGLTTVEQAAAVLIEEEPTLYEPAEVKLTINGNDETEIYNANGFEYVVEDNKEYEIKLEIDGRIATKTIKVKDGISDAWDANKVAIRKDGTNLVPIPKGFEVSTKETEDEVTEGLVITDGTNEFVWIPVADSSSYAEGSFGPLTGTDGTSSYVCDSQEELNYYYGMKEDGTTPYYNYSDFTYKTDKANVENSIKTYGGFYVGRYETTIDGNTIGVQKGKTVLTAETLLKEGANTTSNDEYHYRWWGLYKAQKDMYAQNEAVGSLMISSKQWDAIMTFTGYGSTKRATDTYTTEPDLSGSAYATDNTQFDVSKNIYDLAGNVTEFTINTCYADLRSLYGGNYTGSVGSSSSSWSAFQPWRSYSYFRF